MSERPGNETPPPPPIHDLSTYVTEIKSFPEFTRGNQRAILVKLSAIVGEVNFAFTDGNLDTTSEKMGKFVARVKRVMKAVPHPSFVEDLLGPIRTAVREIELQLDEIGKKLPEDNVFGTEGARVAEQMFLETISSLEERSFNLGHAADIQSGESENVVAVHEIANKITSIISFLEHGILKPSPEQVDRFENALRGWLDTLTDIGEEVRVQHKIDSASIDALIAKMRSLSGRQ